VVEGAAMYVNRSAAPLNLDKNSHFKTIPMSQISASPLCSPAASQPHGYLMPYSSYSIHSTLHSEPTMRASLQTDPIHLHKSVCPDPTLSTLQPVLCSKASHLLPFSEMDNQQLQRKGHIKDMMAPHATEADIVSSMRTAVAVTKAMVPLPAGEPLTSMFNTVIVLAHLPNQRDSASIEHPLFNLLPKYLLPKYLLPKYLLPKYLLPTLHTESATPSCSLFREDKTKAPVQEVLAKNSRPPNVCEAPGGVGMYQAGMEVCGAAASIRDKFKEGKTKAPVEGALIKDVSITSVTFLAWARVTAADPPGKSAPPADTTHTSSEPYSAVSLPRLDHAPSDLRMGHLVAMSPSLSHCSTPNERNVRARPSEPDPGLVKDARAGHSAGA